jgi:MerR family transcriptional regulator, light-induced transcriptional regulator
VAVDAELIGQFREALVAGQQTDAELIAQDAFADGMALADLYVDVMFPGLCEVGERWASGDLSVADEHLATSIVETVMGRLTRAVGPPPRTRDRILMAGVELEGHVVGLRMLADLAEAAGFDVRYLGASVPLDALSDLVSRLRPNIVCLSVSTATPTSSLTEALDLLAERPELQVLIGGSGVPYRLRDDPRTRYAPDVRQALVVLEELAAR